MEALTHLSRRNAAYEGVQNMMSLVDYKDLTLLKTRSATSQGIIFMT